MRYVTSLCTATETNVSNSQDYLFPEQLESFFKFLGPVKYFLTYWSSKKKGKNLKLTITNCAWMNKNSSPKSMTKVYLSWRIMFDMVCEPL